jgi:hypothetical protein
MEYTKSTYDKIIRNGGAIVSQRNNSGGNLTWSVEQIIALAHAVEENSVYSLQELCDIAVAAGFPNVHKSTICRYLRDELDFTRNVISPQNQNRNKVCLKWERISFVYWFQSINLPIVWWSCLISTSGNIAQDVLPVSVINRL